MKLRKVITSTIIGLFGLLLALPASAAGFGMSGSFGGFGGGSMGGGFGHSGGGGGMSRGGAFSGGSRMSAPAPMIRGVAPSTNFGTRGFGDRNFRDPDRDGDIDHHRFDHDRHFRHHRHFDDDGFAFFLGFGLGFPLGYYDAYPYPYYPVYAPPVIVDSRSYDANPLLRDLDLRWHSDGDLLVNWAGDGRHIRQVAFSLLDEDKQVIETHVVRTPPYTVTFRDVSAEAVYIQIAVVRGDKSVDSAIGVLRR